MTDQAPVTAWFVRHAERPPLPTDSSGHDTPITARGVRDAEALGEQLGDRLISLHSSPILRCVQTAEAMARGAGLPLTPVVDAMLGGPGPFVRDLALAWSEWKRLGHDGVLDRLAGDAIEAIPGLHPIGETARAMADRAFASMGDRPGVHVFVTHDVILVPLLRGLSGRRLARTDWPDFLERVELERRGGRRTLRHRGIALDLA